MKIIRIRPALSMRVDIIANHTDSFKPQKRRMDRAIMRIRAEAMMGTPESALK